MSTNIDWDFPYVSKRAPVLAKNVVASSQPLATQAGLDALRRGGNAVDAALATAITLTVVEPCSNGVGSDAFAIVWDGARLHGLNASGKSPQAWSPQKFLAHDEMPTSGWDTVTVPGAVSSWVALSQKFGALPFRDLFESAINYAEHGFPVGHITARVWDASIDRLGAFKGFRNHFLPNGRAPFPGENFQRPDLAHTLSRIAETEGAAFYLEDLANEIVGQAQRENGDLSLDDLANHRVDWVEPLSHPYGSVELHEIPPNGQGLAALIALGILTYIPAKSSEPDTADWVHYQVEAMKIAIRAAFDHISDPNFAERTPSELLDEESLKNAAASITSVASDLPPLSLPTSHDTVYLTAADQSGCMVSMIQSNYMGFGSGIVIEGTGIAMQNRGSGFTLENGHPNQVAGGKRPFHTIIPGFVTKNGKPSMSFGVMGGHMQHQGHVQMVTRIYEHAQNPQAASDAPRWYLTEDFELVLEQGFSADVVQELARRGHNVSVFMGREVIGGAQLIYRLDDGYCAASDHRKEGSAGGF